MTITAHPLSIPPLTALLDRVAAPTQRPCHASDPELWFSDQPHEVEAAKSLCHPCPVRTQCLAAALDRAEPWGVWGGELFDGGQVIPAKRPRGRPRKYPLPAV